MRRLRGIFIALACLGPLACTTFTGSAVAEPAATPSSAAAAPDKAALPPGVPKPDFRTLGVGQKAADIATSGYDGFYCGSNGGVPLKAIEGWTDYMSCKPNEDGLREVAVTFGTKLERMAKMYQEQYGEELWMQQYGGTRVANFPVVMSLLFDKDGVSREFRVVTSSKAERQERARAYLLRFRIYILYGEKGWNCVDRGPSDRRTPVGEMYIDETCTKALDGKRVRVVTHLFRRPGETGTDELGHFLPGQFESSVRWEVFDASLPPTAEERHDDHAG